MKKHLQNLELLCRKMQYRYGDDDELVIELRQELQSVIAKKLAKTAHGQQKEGKVEALLPLH